MGAIRSAFHRNLTPLMAKDDGTHIYTKWFLWLYDSFVLGFSNKYAWRCSTTSVLLPLYRSAMGPRHLEIGVGTGYYPQQALQLGQRCKSITLTDLNPNTIEVATGRIRDVQANSMLNNSMGHEKTTTNESLTIRPIVVNAFDPLPLPPEEKFDSIALFYLLHCVPLPPLEKARIFDLLRPRLAPDGVCVGATILGQGVHRNPLARFLMWFYNSRGVLNNLEDTREVFEQSLRRNFEEVDVDVVGMAMVWRAKGPKVVT